MSAVSLLGSLQALDHSHHNIVGPQAPQRS